MSTIKSRLLSCVAHIIPNLQSHHDYHIYSRKAVTAVRSVMTCDCKEKRAFFFRLALSKRQSNIFFSFCLTLLTFFFMPFPTPKINFSRLNDTSAKYNQSERWWFLISKSYHNYHSSYYPSRDITVDLQTAPYF